MEYYYIWFAVFGVIAYFILTDESAAKAFYFLTKLVRNKFEIMKWWVINNPKTPWTKYSMWRRSNQLAKELMDELKSKTK